MRKTIVGVSGDCRGFDDTKEKLSLELGKALIDNGYRILTGGLKGVMKYVCKGAKQSANYQSGDTIGLLPMTDENEANVYVDIPIATGFDLARDNIIANAPISVFIGGGSGTLGEMANAWTFGRMMIGYTNAQGASSQYAGKMMGMPRFDFEDKVWPVTNAQEVIDTINKHYKNYTTVLHKLHYNKREMITRREPRTEED